jgi:hypothetical protein
MPSFHRLCCSALIVCCIPLISWQFLVAAAGAAAADVLGSSNELLTSQALPAVEFQPEDVPLVDSIAGERGVALCSVPDDCKLCGFLKT